MATASMGITASNPVQPTQAEQDFINQLNGEFENNTVTGTPNTSNYVSTLLNDPTSAIAGTLTPSTSALNNTSATSVAQDVLSWADPTRIIAIALGIIITAIGIAMLGFHKTGVVQSVAGRL